MTGPKAPRDHGEQQDEKWYDKPLYQVLLFAAGIALFGLVLGLILDWYIDPRTSTAKKDLVQALGLITAGVAGAVGIYFTWRSQRLTRQAQEENQSNTLAQLKNAEEQLRLSRQSQEDNQKNTQEQLEQARNELDITRRGQITERFTRAIDQLGSESREIRLGGIYSLERTAREDRDYHWPIMEVLTTYVRTHAPRKRYGDEEEKRRADLQATPLEPEIQAILTVIGRRSGYHSDVEYGPIALHRTDLRKATLMGAKLEGVDLTEAKLKGGILRNAILRRAILHFANLRKADLRAADLEGAYLMGADLRAANLEGAILGNAILKGATLHFANLRNAHLGGVDLRVVVGLTQKGLEMAIGDETTRLPESLERPKSWSQDEGKKTDY